MLLVTTDIKERTVSIHALSQETRDGIAACAQRISGLRTLMMEVWLLSGAVYLFECRVNQCVHPSLEQQAQDGLCIVLLRQ